MRGSQSTRRAKLLSRPSKKRGLLKRSSLIRTASESATVQKRSSNPTSRSSGLSRWPLSRKSCERLSRQNGLDSFPQIGKQPISTGSIICATGVSQDSSGGATVSRFGITKKIPSASSVTLAMIFFVAVLIGSYWFVLYSPEATGHREELRRAERERESG